MADIIHFINTEFDLILILEKLDESLAVLMVKFNLEIDDVITIKNNQFKPKDKLLKYNLDGKVKDKILHINDNDEQVYRYFVEKLIDEIQQIGLSKIDQ